MKTIIAAEPNTINKIEKKIINQEIEDINQVQKKEIGSSINDLSNLLKNVKSKLLSVIENESLIDQTFSRITAQSQSFWAHSRAVSRAPGWCG